jgi:hypothetical protein
MTGTSGIKRPHQISARGEDGEDGEDLESKRRRILAETREIDADDESEEDSDEEEDSDDDDDDDEDAELQRELERVRREREEKKRKEVRNNRSSWQLVKKKADHLARRKPNAPKPRRKPESETLRLVTRCSISKTSP